MDNDEILSEVARTYARDGVVLVRNFLDLRQLRVLVDSLDYARANPGPMSTDLSSNEEDEFFIDFLTFRRNPYMKELCTDTEILKKLAIIVGTHEIRMFHDAVFVKSGDASPTPWHQDRPHYLIEGENNFSIWMSPDDVSENESLAFVPASHKCEKIFHPRSFRDASEINDNSQFVTLTEDIFDELATQGIKVFNFKAGDAIIFDNRTLHSALRSRELAHRRAISIRYVGDGAKLTTNFIDPHPPLHHMGMKLVDGGPPSDVWFPLVYSQ